MLQAATEAIFRKDWDAVNQEEWFQALSPEIKEFHRYHGMRAAAFDAKELVDAIEAKDVEKLYKLLTAGRYQNLFEHFTGITLGRNIEKRRMLLNRWAGPEVMRRIDAASTDRTLRDRRTVQTASRERLEQLRAESQRRRLFAA